MFIFRDKKEQLWWSEGSGTFYLTKQNKTPKPTTKIQPNNQSTKQSSKHYKQQQQQYPISCLKITTRILSRLWKAGQHTSFLWAQPRSMQIPEELGSNLLSFLPWVAFSLAAPSHQPCLQWVLMSDRSVPVFQMGWRSLGCTSILCPERT